MSYRGDIALGATIDIKFTTRAFATGAPTTFAGTPAVAAYVDNGTTEITAGITLTVDFDSRTGLNNVRVVASSGNGFATATNVSLVITAGTVGGTSVVGEEVASFSIENRSGLRPTTAGRTLDVSAGGEAGVDWANVGSPTTSLNLSGTTISTSQVAASVTGNVGGNVTGSVGSIASGGISEASYATTAGSFIPLGVADQGTAQAATSTTLTLRSAAAFGDNTLAGCVAAVFGSTQGYWQAASIASNVGSTDVATLAAAFAVTPSGTITYKIFLAPPADSTAAAIKAVTDKLNGMLELDGGSAGLYQFTPTALAEGGGSPSAIWNYDISAIVTSGLAGTKLNAASSAGDPWGTSLPGAYGVGTAGRILGDNLNATITSRMATYTQPTGFLAATFPTTVASTTNITAGTITTVTNLTNAPTSGDLTATMKASVTAATLSQANVRTAIGLATANLDTQLGTLALASTLAAVKAKTDSLAFTVPNVVDANILRVIGDPVQQNGSTTTNWGGTP